MDNLLELQNRSPFLESVRREEARQGGPPVGVNVCRSEYAKSQNVYRSDSWIKRASGV